MFFGNQEITLEIVDDTTYYTTECRGVIYTAYQTTSGRWYVSTHRKALGPRHIGSGRYYKDINELTATCRALAHLRDLIEILSAQASEAGPSS